MACVDFLFRVSFVRGIEFFLYLFPPFFLVSFYQDNMGCTFFFLFPLFFTLLGPLAFHFIPHCE